MSGQLPLPLDWKAARGARDFFVSAANAEAVRFLDSWAIWPLPVALLVGPAGSGKTHLGGIFARRVNARLWDDADRTAAEEALFHAWNEALETRRPLLMTARSEPEDWHLGLPDLVSRLKATPRVRIHAPDDALLAHLFRKLWRDRGVEVGEELARYVLTRIERSFAGVAQAVEAIDRRALAAGRPPSLALAREALLDLEALEPDFRDRPLPR
ncbi:MAG: DnaA/Hda family protein [Sphingomonadaceae bacterium]|uniref:DnaA ATPase domain-containing protein n=1 Tax=Thermaurantiacus sp. TaxID=2820283 RepID=UPI00298EF2C0|nr:DnaA/Hda family protein [Thermaurantiacus sp.]MCS6986950.1 DnaA/Hda family protein [Sphingomonadaceae bacterium]MDW8415450.1 DnaA/Hda family protein [Thermaurantiacus sp.]